MKLAIALDFDGTYTADPELWQGFVLAAKQDGHEVTLVTVRYPTVGDGYPDSAAERMGIPVVYTAGRQKRAAFDADIWIDDMPESIPTLDAIAVMAKDIRR